MIECKKCKDWYHPSCMNYNCAECREEMLKEKTNYSVPLIHLLRVRFSLVFEESRLLWTPLKSGHTIYLNCN